MSQMAEHKNAAENIKRPLIRFNAEENSEKLTRIV